MTEAVQLEWLRQLPLILTAFGGLIVGVFGAWRAHKAYRQGVAVSQQVERHGAEARQAAVEVKDELRIKTGSLADDLATKMDSSTDELKDSLGANTQLTAAGVVEAKKAFAEANDLNRKIVDQRADFNTLRADFNTSIAELTDLGNKNRKLIEEARDREARHAAANRENAEELRRRVDELAKKVDKVIG